MALQPAVGESGEDRSEWFVAVMVFVDVLSGRFQLLESACLDEMSVVCPSGGLRPVSS